MVTCDNCAAVVFVITVHHEHDENTSCLFEELHFRIAPGPATSSIAYQIVDSHGATLPQYPLHYSSVIWMVNIRFALHLKTVSSGYKPLSVVRSDDLSDMILKRGGYEEVRPFRTVFSFISGRTY